MADVKVSCVTKVKHDNPHEGITHLGGTNWYWRREAVIASIESKTNTFHTVVNGNRAYLGVVNGKNGKYLRTYADKVWTDNLLALTACSIR